MTGLCYWRNKKRFSKASLSEKTGLSTGLITQMEKRLSPYTVLSIYIKLAEALGVTVDQLLEEYDDAELGVGDHGSYRTGKGIRFAPNCIAEYRIIKNFTFQELGGILGLTSRQGAKRICDLPDAPEKYVKTLAAREKISAEEFRLRYEPKRTDLGPNEI